MFIDAISKRVPHFTVILGETLKFLKQKVGMKLCFFLFDKYYGN